MLYTCVTFLEPLLSTKGRTKCRGMLAQLGLDRMELPTSAVQPVSRKRARPDAADSPAASGTPCPTPPAAPPASASAQADLAVAALERLQVLSRPSVIPSMLIENISSIRLKVAIELSRPPLHNSPLFDLQAALPFFAYF